jgi:hypothetical protein
MRFLKRLLKTNLISTDSNWQSALERWHLYSAPFRPSQKDMQHYETVLSENKIRMNSSALILGATPELRALFSRVANMYTVSDRSKEMLAGMCGFSDLIVRNKEKWVQKDWFSLNSRDHICKYDVICGDLVLRNISYKRQHAFLTLLSSLLKKRGILIIRCHTLNTEYCGLTVDEIFRISTAEYHGADKHTIEDTIVSRLFDKYVDVNSKTIDIPAFRQGLASVLHYDHDELRTAIEYKWGSGVRTWTQRSVRDLEDLITVNFMIIDKKIADDYPDSMDYPLLVMQKK